MLDTLPAVVKMEARDLLLDSWTSLHDRNSTEDEDRHLKQCWIIGSCDACIRSGHVCAWCPSVSHICVLIANMSLMKLTVVFMCSTSVWWEHTFTNSRCTYLSHARRTMGTTNESLWLQLLNYHIPGRLDLHPEYNGCTDFPLDSMEACPSYLAEHTCPSRRMED